MKKLLLNNLYENPKFIELSNHKNKKEFEEWLINYQDINKSCGTKIYNPLKLYYFNKYYIHRILYDKEEIIRINSNKYNLSYYFYLSLLIRDNPNIVNYSYSFDFIKIINDNINNGNNKCKKILLSKIILELIENYKNLDEFDDNQNDIQNKITIMETENNNIIKDNINNFNREFNLQWKEGDLKLNKIDKIYLEVIKH